VAGHDAAMPSHFDTIFGMATQGSPVSVQKDADLQLHSLISLAGNNANCKQMKSAGIFASEYMLSILSPLQKISGTTTSVFSLTYEKNKW